MDSDSDDSFQSNDMEIDLSNIFQDTPICGNPHQFAFFERIQSVQNEQLWEPQAIQDSPPVENSTTFEENGQEHSSTYQSSGLVNNRANFVGERRRQGNLQKYADKMFFRQNVVPLLKKYQKVTKLNNKLQNNDIILLNEYLEGKSKHAFDMMIQGSSLLLKRHLIYMFSDIQYDSQQFRQFMSQLPHDNVRFVTQLAKCFSNKRKLYGIKTMFKYILKKIIACFQQQNQDLLHSNTDFDIVDVISQ